MKKLILPVIAALALGVTSCGGPSLDDVNVAEIKDACGCVDGMKTVSDVMVAEAEKHGNDAEKLEKDPESKKVFDEAGKKSMELMKKCSEELKLKPADMEKCPSFKEFEASAKKLEGVK